MFWFTDLRKYFDRIRRELEDDSNPTGESGESNSPQLGRGKRRKRKLLTQIADESVQGEYDEEGEWEELPPELLREVEREQDRPEKKQKCEETKEERKDETEANSFQLQAAAASTTSKEDETQAQAPLVEFK